jgi:hypothetical protein
MIVWLIYVEHKKEDLTLSSEKKADPSLAVAKIQIECIGSIEMEKGLMHALCTHYF